MLEFAWPWAFLALLVPLLARLVLPRTKSPGGMALRVPFYVELLALGGKAQTGGVSWRTGALAMIYLLLCVAAARPQWVGEPIAPPQSGRDLMLAVDTSGSMSAEDMGLGGRRMDRLEAVKIVLGDFLERRAGDRLGLILFGQNAYLVTPLTFDRNSVRYQLDTTTVGLAGRETAIGDAIGLAVKRLRDRPAEHRVLIILTDGANNAGELEPMQAAELARAHQVRVYTVAFGSDSQRGPFGMMMPSAEIDEAALQEIADATGGRFFRARNTADLAGIYRELDQLEALPQEAQSIRPREELFTYPAAAALILAVVMLLLQPLALRLGAAS